jgi:hypothetical protein
MNRNGNPACGAMIYIIIAVVTLSMSLVFLKAVRHTESAQPRSPMHDSR